MSCRGHLHYRSRQRKFLEHQRGKLHDRRSGPERARGNRKKEVQRGEGFKRQKVYPIKGGDPVSWAPLAKEVCGRIALR